MKKLTQVHCYAFDAMYNTPEQAVDAGISYDKLRKQQLKLDVSVLQGKCVKELYWDLHTLVLEFEQNLFLVLQAREDSRDNDNLGVSIETINPVVTQYESLCVKIVGIAGSADVMYNYRKIADKYIGKQFKDIFLINHQAFLYFKGMPLLIECMVCELKETPGLFMSWFENV